MKIKVIFILLIVCVFIESVFLLPCRRRPRGCNSRPPPQTPPPQTPPPQTPPPQTPPPQTPPPQTPPPQTPSPQTPPPQTPPNLMALFQQFIAALAAAAPATTPPA
ncbi:uncharacterized protein LOC129567168 isoform X2 [Sitodiplosis mosellana]|uniref:uncharacterized protein LOC129567168 isoform X2 n=1 Tax=Sitodiplosis mosellana TaxID=263140 RepID=UPI0024447AFB|nr:uncharacterized protein LOC129567168 isoform X2 [Sitodiplosis mosellana]